MPLFALLLPLILFLAVLSVDVGNWWVHKRRLQTQVDAAALAAGPSFTGCSQDANATNTRIAAEAAKYAGDTRRDKMTLNRQVQEPDDVFVALNSHSYWQSSDGSTPGYGLDYKMGDPCTSRFLDVKATDHAVSPLWGRIKNWRDFPTSVSPTTHAKIEIRQVQSTSGLLPFGVREIDPERVAAIFVNEDADPASPEAVVGKGWLNRQSLPSGDPLSAFNTWRGDIGEVNLNGNENFGVVILTRRSGDASLGGSLQAMCGAAQTTCYAGALSDSGLSFIHSYSDSGSGSAAQPRIRQVELAGGCGQSAPYFNLDDGTSCNPIVIQAKIDFGATGNPTLYPTCATVSSSPGGPMTWSPGGLGGALGTWTGSFTPAVESGRTRVDLSWTTDNEGPAEPPNCDGAKFSDPPFGRVAGPYVADADSGPVQYLAIESPPGIFANSINGNPSVTVTVTVGLIPPLVDAPLTAQPIRLRFRGSSSQARALACDGSSQWRFAIINGCETPYQVNERDGSCGAPDPVPPDCIEVRTEPPDVLSEELRQGMRERFGGPSCTPNNWDGIGVPSPSDPRWIALFITGENTPGTNVLPIRRFGGFYVTAAAGMDCPGDNPLVAGEANVWGHFVSYVTSALGNPVPKAELCTFVGAGLCTPVLVE